MSERVKNGTDAALRISAIIPKLKCARYHLEGLRLNQEKCDEIEELLRKVESETQRLDDFAEFCLSVYDPSDGPFLAQEPEEPDGFCDCPECCGE